jgi:hypothetical protein
MKSHSTRRPLSALLPLFGSAALALYPALARADPPDHLVWAEDLVFNVTPALNEYGSSPSYINWAGVNGATQYENRSLCTTFTTLVLRQAYGWTTTYFSQWMGTTSPNAARYHDTIVEEDGFVRLYAATDIQAGDIIAVRYPEGGSVSGHVATARGPAVPRTATSPIVSGTDQHELPIVDSSSTGHGPTDTRLMPDGTWDAGAGAGVMRLYTDAQGIIVGYTWSTLSVSIYYDLSERHLVVGRLQ